MPRKVLIATPLKGDVPKSYFLSSLQLYAGRIPDVKLDWLLLDGPAVQVARNELAHYAIEQGFDEMVFWDKDVLAEDEEEKNVTAGAVLRLLEHDVDFVCALYANRALETHWHVQTIPGEEADEKTGLQKVKRCAIGFSKIKVSALKKVAKDNADRRMLLVDPANPPRMMTEFFPMGIYGKNTPEYRVKQIAQAIKELKEQGKDGFPLSRLDRELTVEYDEPNAFLGEDYWFCEMMQASGFPVYLDTFLVLGHRSSVTIPIATHKLIKLLGEDWRRDEIKATREALLKEKHKHEEENQIANAIRAAGQT